MLKCHDTCSHLRHNVKHYSYSAWYCNPPFLFSSHPVFISNKLHTTDCTPRTVLSTLKVSSYYPITSTSPVRSLHHLTPSNYKQV